MHVGDTFAPDAHIKWTSPRQAMKAVDTTTGKAQLYVGEEFEGLGAKSLKSYIAQKKHLSTNEGAKASLREAAPEMCPGLGDRLYLIDRVEIETSAPIDANHYFFITVPRNGSDESVPVYNTRTGFAITKSMFDHADTDAEGNVTIKIWYFDKAENKVEAVNKGIAVTVLPYKLRK